MATSGALTKQAFDFAAKLTELLNSTVTDNVRLAAVFSEEVNRVHLGYRLSKHNLVSRQYFPLRQRDNNPRLYMQVSAQCVLDPEKQYLTMHQSVFALAFDEDGEREFCHFDYERDKGDGYPESHFQINADSEFMQDYLSKCKEAEPPLRSVERDEEGRRVRGPRIIGKIHFPSGSRRFRTSLEDIVEFLVGEKIVPDLTMDQQNFLNQSRQDFHDLQLCAAIRRRPEVAATALRSAGWSVQTP
ncbi:hypothetical protein [Paractinoplanes toevensis]|uniref:Uncharacterized protein n=1 Tax=Paractinoplanes toevensis TaxID=571911 RepID=A0A920BP28_9ACTN|nr:hypothetical protein [Actinoplanes toevensis]GIM96104.1 hypothetical protein Ato02nite_078970 [Actinoplanes toevensis]